MAYATCKLLIHTVTIKSSVFILVTIYQPNDRMMITLV